MECPVCIEAGKPVKEYRDLYMHACILAGMAHDTKHLALAVKSLGEREKDYLTQLQVLKDESIRPKSSEQIKREIQKEGGQNGREERGQSGGEDIAGSGEIRREDEQVRGEPSRLDAVLSRILSK